MAGRKKASPAADRTLGMFNGGLTPLEEKEQAKKDEEGRAAPPADRTWQGTRESQAKTALRWLGFDIFADPGDDLAIVKKNGAAVLMVIFGSPKSGSPSRTVEVTLSSKHVEKLKLLARDL